MHLHKKIRNKPVYRTMSSLMALALFINVTLPPSLIHAQTVPNLPAPGTMVPLSAEFVPVIVRGLKIHPDNPLKFNFIIDTGDTSLSLDSKAFRKESEKLVKYFLASLTVPETDLWVNLSPYETDRIISRGLGETEMGTDLLGQDYLLKQLTASLISPEEELGGEFWKRVHQKAQERYGTIEIPISTFNKIWIVPDKGVVYERDGTAFVIERHLKVMLEEDYMALRADQKREPVGTGRLSQKDAQELSGLSSEVVREVIIPEIEKEVNEGKNFAALRQIYNSMILAVWYKKNLRESLLGQVYFDQNKTKGIDVEDKTGYRRIYDQYIDAFKKGIYERIREDYDQKTREMIPKKYFTGGAVGFAESLLEEVRDGVSSPVAAAKARQAVSELTVGDMGDIEVGLLENGDRYLSEQVGAAQASTSSPLDNEKGLGLTGAAPYETDVYDQEIRRTIFGRRASGVLMHFTSLPSRKGIGDLGEEAYRFVDFLAATGQSYWQTLPFGPTNPDDNSPYNSPSVYAGNELLISLDLLVEAGWLSPETVDAIPVSTSDRVDDVSVRTFNDKALAAAYNGFKADSNAQEDFDRFVTKNGEEWLDNFALYTVLKKNYDGRKWYEWDDRYKLRNEEALMEFIREHNDEIDQVKFEQYIFDKQLRALRAYANQKGIKLYGDMPIYPAMNSADVWANPQLFQFAEDLTPLGVAGVPPDAFSKTGQLWGNPLYNWAAHQSEDFKWWRGRLRRNLELFDYVRIDHFRGLVQYWSVPFGDETAMNGKWVDAPTNELFKALRTVSENQNQLPIIAEDLGTITKDVIEARDGNGLPGLGILQFAFDGDPNNTYLPDNIGIDRVVYTGTHDNPPTKVWFASAKQEEKDRLSKTLAKEVDPDNVHWQLIEMAMETQAAVTIFPMQDILGLGEEGMMNRPGIAGGNWTWRLTPGQLDSVDKDKLRQLTATTGRLLSRDKVDEERQINPDQARYVAQVTAGSEERAEELLKNIARINAGDNYDIVMLEDKEGRLVFVLKDLRRNTSIMVSPLNGLRILSFTDGSSHEVLNANGLFFGFPLGRIKEGKFSWRGKDYDFNDQNGIEFYNRNLLHLGQNMAWTVDTIDIDREGVFIRAHIDSDDSNQIIGRARHTITIKLSGNDLLIDRLTENLDTQPIPDLFGVHDWIAVKEGTTIEGPASQVFATNDDLEPGELVAAEGNFDISRPRVVNNLGFDTTFKGMTADDDGFWRVQLNNAGDGRRVVLLAEARAFPAVTIWTGWEGNVSIEPVTVEQFALNRQEADNTLLRTIAPGDSVDGRVIIRSEDAEFAPPDDSSPGEAKSSSPVGGIDLDPALLDLQVRRDGNGVPLPLIEQPVADMRIDGFLPVIIRVTPFELPLLLGATGTGANRMDLGNIFRLDPMDKKMNLNMAMIF